jgi:hypothetical protein
VFRYRNRTVGQHFFLFQTYRLRSGCSTTELNEQTHMREGEGKFKIISFFRFHVGPPQSGKRRLLGVVGLAASLTVMGDLLNPPRLNFQKGGRNEKIPLNIPSFPLQHGQLRAHACPPMPARSPAGARTHATTTTVSAQHTTTHTAQPLTTAQQRGVRARARGCRWR